MKTTRMKGIAHDLANHLGFEIGFNRFKGIGRVKTDVLKLRKDNEFDKHCVDFVKERLPKNFDFNRLKHVFVEVELSSDLNKTVRNVAVVIEWDDKNVAVATISLDYTKWKI